MPTKLRHQNIKIMTRDYTPRLKEIHISTANIAKDLMHF